MSKFVISSVSYVLSSLPTYHEYFRGVVFFGHLVEELYYVREVHVAVHDDIPVVLDECKGDEEIEV